jgi:amino acid adenylation domain-containing protein
MPSSNSSYYPLSSNQAEVWFDQILNPDIPFYNIGGYFHINGLVDRNILEKAIRVAVKKNDAIRIYLYQNETLPVQEFVEEIPIELKLYDFSDKENSYAQACSMMEKEFTKPFQLYGQKLFHFDLFKISEKYFLLFAKIHHLITDGWGNTIFWQRVAEEYNTLLQKNEHNSLKDEKIYSYLDFLKYNAEYLESKKFELDKQYWQEKFKTIPDQLVHRKKTIDREACLPSKRSSLEINRDVYNQLNQLASAHNSSIYYIFLATLYCYFVQINGSSKNFVIGLPTLNRSSKDLKKTVGMFASLSPARFDFGLELSFGELLKNIGKELRKDYRHQRFPLSEINKGTGLHQTGRRQLFDVVLSYAKHDYSMHFGGATIRSVFMSNGYDQNALSVFIEEFHENEDVNIYFDYNTGAFGDFEIDILKSSFESILHQALKCPEKQIKDFQITPSSEYDIILNIFNNTSVKYNKNKTVIDLFHEQVAINPHAKAVSIGRECLTYAELNKKSNQIAHQLIERGIGPEKCVGVCCERSFELIVGILGVLKSGGAYVPLDPQYPQKRLEWMLTDSQVEIILTQEKWYNQLSEHECEVVCLDALPVDTTLKSEQNPAIFIAPKSLIYVIYTSGSTGRPKGAGVKHIGFANLVNWYINTFSFTSDDNALIFSSFSFDLTQKNIFAPLAVGGTLHLTPPGPYDPELINATIHEESITWINCSPSAFYPLVDNASRSLNFQVFSSLRYILLGGEPISMARLSSFLDADSIHAEIINSYGPTECTDVCAFFNVSTANLPLDASPPIGRPINNAQIYILDQYQNLLPRGITGELYIGGDGVGAGYINNNDLNGKFIKNPFDETSNSLLYKTGDLARYLENGDIEYIERIDNQIKIRGYRIEIGEIETILNQHQKILQSVVSVWEKTVGEQNLIAYYVSHDEKPEHEALRNYLHERLPSYMVPVTYLSIDHIPLTPNGKIDRKALPYPTFHEVNPININLPETPTEKIISDIVTELLNYESIDLFDNLFDLGVDSLTALTLLFEIEQRLGKKLMLSSFFQGPTIKRLASLADNNSHQWSCLVPIQPKGNKNPFFCVPGVGGNVIGFYELANHLGTNQPFYGLQSKGLDGQSQPFTSIESMAEFYLNEVTSIQNTGPYMLGGHSFGALVAFEMAQQLLKKGHEVDLLAIFDMCSPCSIARDPQELEDSDNKWLKDAFMYMEQVSGKSMTAFLNKFQTLSNEEKLEYLLKKLIENGILPVGSNTTQIRGLVDVYKANRQMNYLPKNPIPCRISLFKAQEQNDISQMDVRLNISEATWGWRKYSEGDVEIHTVSGNHYSMLRSPSVSELVSTLSHLINPLPN